MRFPLPPSLILAAAASSVVLGCGSDDPAPAASDVANVDAERILAADSEPGNWMAHGRTFDEQRFSPLQEINDESIHDLALTWSYDTGIERGHEATPIVVDGTMFVTTAWSNVIALDAKTGAEIWRYDPHVPREWAKFACCDVVNRGVAVHKGMVISATLDGRLLALDAATGEPRWEVNTIDRKQAYTITGAPRIVKGRVIIGNGGGEYGVRGYITAYDAETGKQEWRFYTVPGNPADGFENDAMRRAADTWGGAPWWENGGGGTVWDAMAYDAELDLLYIGVGNGSPWNQQIRSPAGGDNLYLSSIVALRPDTGDYVWHYQTTPGETWDYTATQHLILADLDFPEGRRKVLMQAPKNGFFYVIDRTDGTFISAEKYVTATWASSIDPETGRPIRTQNAGYEGAPQVVLPGPLGGHNWHPMSYSPDTGLVYIPAIDIPFVYGKEHDYEYEPGRWNLGVDFALTIPPRDLAQLAEVVKDVKGHLSAWNPVTQTEEWRAPYAHSWNGGVLSTAGNLVFQGTSDGKLRAFTADEGRAVWEFEAGQGIIAAPIAWSQDGEQYITVVAGYGGAFPLTAGVATRPYHHPTGRVMTFKLGGTAQLPPGAQPPSLLTGTLPNTVSTDPIVIAHGEVVYHQYCGVCHGAGAFGGGVLPDLRLLSTEGHAKFVGTVLTGIPGTGMTGFSDVLDVKKVQAIQSFIAEQTRSHKEAGLLK